MSQYLENCCIAQTVTVCVVISYTKDVFQCFSEAVHLCAEVTEVGWLDFFILSCGTLDAIVTHNRPRGHTDLLQKRRPILGCLEYLCSTVNMHLGHNARSVTSSHS